MTSTITTSTNASPFAYPGNTLMTHYDLPNDPATWGIKAGTARLIILVKTSTANQFAVFYADNPWPSWDTFFPGTSTITRANIVDSGSWYAIAGDPWIYWVYRTNESSQDRIYLRRLSGWTGTWDAEVLIDAQPNGGVAGAVFGGLDLVAHPSGGMHYIAIAAGITVGGQVGLTLRGVAYQQGTGAGAPPTVTQAVYAGTKQWLYTGSGRIQPSIDMEHIGDGHTSSAPHAWVGFGRDRLQVVKLAWSGGGWNTPVTAQELVAPTMPVRDYTTARWDGGQFIMAVPDPTTTTQVMLVERNQANTTTTTRRTTPHPTGVVRHVGLSYNVVTRDARVYAIGTSTTVLYYIDYIRATGLWTSWAVVTATAVLGSTGQEWGVRRGSYSDARHDVYTAHASNALVHTSQTLSYAPFSPTWQVTSGKAYDVAAILPLDWNFSDSDPGDTQSAYAISRQIGAGTVAYWRASDSTWQPAEVQNTSSTSAVNLAAAWGVGTDLPHTYKVKVWDTAPTASGYSDALVVIPTVVVNPAITAPTPAQVLTGDTVTVTWTAAEETAYRVILYITAGNVQLADSGWVAGTALTYTVPYTLLNGGAYTVTLQTMNNEGFPSVVQSRAVTVSFLAPDTPTIVATPVPASGWIAIVITNPAPTGGRPSVSNNDVWRRPIGDTTDGVRVGAAIAPSGTYNDWQAVDNIPYEYRILANGTNGTSVYGAWTS